MADMQSCQNKVAVILPSLDPDAKFTRVVEGLVENGFQHVVIVDDGSSAERQRFFEEAARHPECTVIHHGVNKGKGRALKTAFDHVRRELPELEGVITIDGDGQHLFDIIPRILSHHFSKKTLKMRNWPCLYARLMVKSFCMYVYITPLFLRVIPLWIKKTL